MRLFAKEIHFIRTAIALPVLSHVNSQNKAFRPNLAVDDVVRA